MFGYKDLQLTYYISLKDKLTTHPGEVKKCGVTKTISPPTIKQEPLDDPNQSMQPDSSSDLHAPRSPLKRPPYHQQRVKTEFEVKQEPCWDGEVPTTVQNYWDHETQYEASKKVGESWTVAKILL